MPHVLLTIGEVGVAIEVQERLERVGHAVTWDTERLGGAGDELVDVVIMPGGDDVGARIDRWRQTASVPAMVVLGGAGDLDAGNSRGVPVLRSTEALLPALEQALASRFGTALSVDAARAALGLDASLRDEALAAAIIAAGRSVAPRVVRDALESRRRLYVSATPLCATLRESRALDVPEIEIARASTGATTLEAVIKACTLPALEAGGRVWAMASAGALRFDAEPPDDATTERRRVRAARAHIRRRTTLTMPTAYDVLELTRGAYVEDVEAAVQALGFRFAAQALVELDLGGLESVAASLWDRILEARAALYYEAGQKQLDNFVDLQLAQDPRPLARSWARPDINAKAAAAAFARGQTALGAGEVFKAVSEMAAAARAQPGHPVYEAYLAWTRYRSNVARGSDRAATARKERAFAEEAMTGRRPYAQALVALGLLCVADGDAASARWHLGEALALDPALPAARLILKRL